MESVNVERDIRQRQWKSSRPVLEYRRFVHALVIISTLVRNCSLFSE